MKYFTSTRKRRRGGRQEWIARLVYKDEATGVKKEKSKSAGSQAEAKRIEKELEREFLAGGQIAVESHEMSIGALLEHCLKTRYYEAEYDSEGRKKGGVRGKDTIDSHIKTLAGFFGAVKDKEGPEGVYVGGMRVREIRVGSLRACRTFLLKDRSIATANRIMSTLRAILNEAMINDWIIVNPFSKVKAGELISIADERERETILTPAEEQKLLEACSGDTRRHLRALVIAALDTGARQGELFGLRWVDVNFDEGVITNITSYKAKTVQHREVPLTGRLKAALQELKEKRCVSAFRVRRKTGIKPDEDLVFGISTNVQRSWQAAREDAGLEHVRFHDLRHTAATRLARKMQLALVGQVLGHTDPKTTRRYVNRTRQTINQAATILEEWQEEQKSVLKGEQSEIDMEVFR